MIYFYLPTTAGRAEKRAVFECMPYTEYAEIAPPSHTSYWVSYLMLHWLSIYLYCVW